MLGRRDVAPLASTPRDDVPNLIIKEKPMKHSKNILNVWIGIVLALASTPVLAGEPTDQIKETIDVVLTLVNNPDLKEAERQKLIRQAADKRFHWTAIARSAMGVYWQNLTQEQKEEFTGLFTDLIESVYIQKIESYSGEKILYLGDDTDDGYGTVKMTIITHKGTEIPISYRVVEEKGQWLIYDVRVEGISMVNNYRKQISYIMNNSSYEELAKKLKEKIEGGDNSSQ
jgi:phospholipid transport system substrate-binding protein